MSEREDVKKREWEKGEMGERVNERMGKWEHPFTHPPIHPYTHPLIPPYAHTPIH